MALLEVKGYCNRPATKESSKGTYATFTLAERQKGRDGQFTKVFYDCVDFNNEAPPDGAFVTVKGYLNMKEYTSRTGEKKTGYNVNVQSIEVAPPRDGASSPRPAPAGSSPDNWDF